GHVVDPPSSPLVIDCERNRGGDVLNVAACPPPARVAFLEHDHRTVIVHPLQVTVETVLRIPRPVRRRQTQDRHRHRPSTNSLLDVDVVESDLLATRIRCRSGAKWRILSQWHGVRRPRLAPPQSPERAIYVAARDHYPTAGDPAEG